MWNFLLVRVLKKAFPHPSSLPLRNRLLFACSLPLFSALDVDFFILKTLTAKMSGTSLPSNLFVFISIALLSRLSTSVIISRAESENRLPANDEFTAVFESLEQQRDMEIERVVRDKRKKAQREEGREEERSENHRDEEVVDGDWAKMLHGLLAFNKGLDINNTETQCRLDCVNRWLIPTDDSPPMRLCRMLEADWPTKYNLFSRSSCGMWSRIECLPRSPLISNISFFNL